jgi:hypothetical protein
MTTLDTLTLALPAHWLPALINDDTSGLDTAEAAAFSRWLYDTTLDLGYPLVCDVDTDAGPHFARYHDAAEYGVKACNCYDVTFHYMEARQAA